PMDTNVVPRAPSLEDHPLAGIHFWASQAQPSETVANPPIPPAPTDLHPTPPSLLLPSPDQDSTTTIATDAITTTNHTPKSEPSSTPHATLAARTLIHLANFSPDSEILSSNKSKDAIIRLLLDWKVQQQHHRLNATNVHIKHPTGPTVLPALKPGAKAIDCSCVITGRKGKYKDPASGLAYCDLQSYRAVRRLARGEEGRWSVLLGAFVGGGVAARGVPEGFASRV
ncbi:hypothetical protein LTS18_013610, partial [Coniosporium uncinatum]